MPTYTDKEADALLGHGFVNYRGFAYMGHPEKILHIIIGDHQFVPATNLPLDTVQALQYHDRDLAETVELHLERQSQLRCVASEIRYVHNGIVRRLREENGSLRARVHELEGDHQELEFALADLRGHFERLLGDYKRGDFHNVDAYNAVLASVGDEGGEPPLAEILATCARDYADMQARCADAERQVAETRDVEALQMERRQDALVLLRKATKALDFMLPSAKFLADDQDTAVASYARHNVLVYASVLESIHGALDAFSGEYSAYGV